MTSDPVRTALQTPWTSSLPASPEIASNKEFLTDLHEYSIDIGFPQVYGIPVSISDGIAVVNASPVSAAHVLLATPIVAEFSTIFSTQFSNVYTLQCGGVLTTSTTIHDYIATIATVVPVESILVRLHHQR